MLTSGVRIGAYVMEEQLGQGGMAAVWRARHEKLGSLHAIKFLLPEFARSEEIRLRFLNEGRIQAQLRHPAIVPVTDLLEQGASVGLVMEYVEGRALDALLREQRPLSMALVREIFLQVLGGLGHVHARGVVHRDLKPSNIMLDETQRGLRARVLDFGVAKFEAENAPALTRTGMTLGTLQYMSPEQVRGEAVDARSDLFSLGVVLYEVVTGRIPFDGSSAWSLQMAIVSGKVVPPETVRADLPPAMADLLRRALETEPATRFQSCEELSRTLELATRPDGGQPWAAPTTPPPVVSATPTRNERTPKAVLSVSPRDELDGEEQDLELAFKPRRSNGPVVVLALLLAAGGGYFAWHRSQAPSGPDSGAMDEIVRATVQTEPQSGLRFVRLPGGEFRMGCEPHDTLCAEDEPKPRVVRLDGFWMGKTEATVEAWEKCVAAGACAATARNVVNAEGQKCNPGERDKKQHPVNCLTWAESKAFCRWLGGRLPTSAEWEFAAKSGGRAIWPWGDTPPTRDQARFVERDDPEARTSPVGAHPKGATLWGLHDLAGNVWEVTSDFFDAKKGTAEARGGSFKSKAKWLRASNRFEVEPSTRSDSLGVRCAFDDRPEG